MVKLKEKEEKAEVCPEKRAHAGRFDNLDFLGRLLVKLKEKL